MANQILGEFGVRLSLEGKFVYVDGKSSSSLGYSSLELLGKSYFEYIHVDDLDKIEDSFGKRMWLQSENNNVSLVNQCGEIQAPMYRLMTKGRQWLWVQPRLYLQFGYFWTVVYWFIWFLSYDVIYIVLI